MDKRGQVTVFIILGILVVIGILLLAVPRMRPPLEQETQLQNVRSEVQQSVDSCLQQVGLEAVQYISSKGGYFDPPASYDNGSLLPFYAYLAEDNTPTQATVERELSKYVDKQLFFCVQDSLSWASSQGMRVDVGQSSTTAMIRQDDVDFTTRLPVTLGTGSAAVTQDSFIADVGGVRLREFLDVAKDIVVQQIKAPTLICISCLIDLGTKHGMRIETMDRPDDVVILLMLDKASNQTFSFAIKQPTITCDNVAEASRYMSSQDALDFTQSCAQQAIAKYNYSLTVDPIPDMTAQVGVPFHHQVVAHGSDVSYSDMTYLFDINTTSGAIDFTPSSDDVGDHLVTVIAKDDLGNEQYGRFNLTIR